VSVILSAVCHSLISRRQSDVLAGHLIQLNSVPFPDGFPPPSTAIEASCLPEEALTADPHEIFSSYSPSVPPTSQQCDLFTGDPYRYPGAIPPPVQPSASASWFGEDNDTRFSMPDNYTEEQSLDCPPFTSGEPILETDSVFFDELHSTIFTASESRAESIDYQMECSASALNEELIFSSEDDDVDQLPSTLPTTLPIVPINSTVVFDEALVWTDTNSPVDKDFRNAICRSLNTSLWKRPFLLTKCIFAGSFWVGLANPFKVSQADQCELLTNSLLAALHVHGTTLKHLLSKPREYLPWLLQVTI
jgi:hypothetical protein